MHTQFNCLCVCTIACCRALQVQLVRVNADLPQQQVFEEVRRQLDRLQLEATAPVCTANPRAAGVL